MPRARFTWFSVSVTLMLLIFFVGLAATAYMYKHVPTAFVPQEDQGYFIIQVQAPQGASLSYTGRLVDQAQASTSRLPRRRRARSRLPVSVSAGSAPNYGDHLRQSQTCRQPARAKATPRQKSSTIFAAD